MIQPKNFPQIIRSLALAVSLFHVALNPTTVRGQSTGDNTSTHPETTIELVVLGIAQDAGFPQANCEKQCCAAAWKDHQLRRMVSCLGLVDQTAGKRWMLDCTPDFPDQLRLLNAQLDADEQTKANPASNAAGDIPTPIIDGIFLTHAHIGHYTGLIHLGREVIGGQKTPVYAMPRMRSFLTKDGPWSQLVSLNNIQLEKLEAQTEIRLGPHLTITPFQVPHRDEFSETVGFLIEGPSKKAIYLPDIDKWSRWNKSIESLIEQVDFAFIDGTFLANGEIPGRDMELIPHPFIQETISRFSSLDLKERSKVRFIHLNHTNPLISPSSPARKTIERAGMKIANQGDTIKL